MTLETMPDSKKLIDRYGREHNTLRLSVVDRCNLRCHYCMPAEGMEFYPRQRVLSFEDILFAVQQANALGVTRLRITGGEPLLRRDLPVLIKMLYEQTDIEDIALTTNGILLAKHAESLANSGLKRINVSLDSLHPERFTKITRNGILDDVWKGIEIATKAGLSPIRINTLLLKGFNEDEVEDWLRLTIENGITVRFMELMPIGEGAKMEGIGTYLNLTEIKDALVEKYGLEPVKLPVGNGPARYWQKPGAMGSLGFITPLSNSYCDTCSRLRLTSTGEIRACLAFDEHVDIHEAIRSRDVDAVNLGFKQAVWGKQRGHHWQSGQTTAMGMSTLGG